MIKTRLWVQALIRQCDLKGIGAVIAKSGAPEAGAVYLLVTTSRTEGKIFAPAPGPTYDDDGKRNWHCPLGELPVALSDAQEYLERQRRFDPDIWIIDIDDPKGQIFANEIHSSLSIF